MSASTNSGRSQMAAGLLDRLAEGRVHVRSAGSDPADQLNPNVIKAMKEIDVDICKEFPKPLTDEVVRAADVVVTMGCGDACPIYPGKHTRIGISRIQPASRSGDGAARIRDEIQRENLSAAVTVPRRGTAEPFTKPNVPGRMASRASP